MILSRHSILIENLGETLEAVLTPVIQRAVIYRGRKMYIKLGDSEAEFHPDFRCVPSSFLLSCSILRCMPIPSFRLPEYSTIINIGRSRLRLNTQRSVVCVRTVYAFSVSASFAILFRSDSELEQS